MLFFFVLKFVIFWVIFLEKVQISRNDVELTVQERNFQNNVFQRQIRQNFEQQKMVLLLNGLYVVANALFNELILRSINLTRLKISLNELWNSLKILISSEEAFGG